MIQMEKEKYKINLTDDEISQISKYRFKTLIDKKINTFAFQYLKEKASSHSKSMKILKEVENKTIVKRKTYLTENILHKNDCQLLFELRSKMLDVKTNFKNLYNKDLTCRTCRKVGVVENEDHLLQCEMLKSEVGDETVEYDYVFQTIEKQKIALKAYRAVLRKREIMLKYHDVK